MTFEEAKAQMPDGYRLVEKQVVLLPPNTADTYLVYLGDQLEFGTESPKRAVDWAQFDAKRKSKEAVPW